MNEKLTNNNLGGDKNNKKNAQTFSKRNFYVAKDSGLILIFVMLFSLLLALLVSFLDSSWVVMKYLVTPISFIAVFFAYNGVQQISLSATKLNFKKVKPVSALLCMIVGIVAVCGFVWLIEGCFGKLFSIFGVKRDGFDLPINTVGWLFLDFLILGVLPAVAEELIFRGVFFQGLREKFSSFASVMITSLCFALMHQNLQQFIYPFILGAILAVVMEKTGNLIYPILIHMFNNFATILTSFLMATGKIPSTFNLQWWGILCAIAVAALTCFVLWLLWRFYLKKHEKFELEKQGQVTGSEPVYFGKFPLSLIVAIAVVAVLFLLSVVLCFV